MSVTRRDFLLAVPLAGGAVVLLPFGARTSAAQPALAGAALTDAVAGSSVEGPALAAVLSFHLDQPWLDATGRADPYHPPLGARGAAPLAQFDDATLARFYGLI
jgi:hypothetical protein